MSPQQTKVNTANKSTPTPSGRNQEVATLVVMIVVLTIIILFCCFAAPGVRDLCKKYVFRTCVMDDPDIDNASAAGESATPTIILLPYGRMLVVDRAVFAQLQADHTGIDFMELSANLIRAQRYQAGSTPSILDSETTSKGLSPTSLGFSPPAYEDIFGDKSDLPPSYSEVSLMFRTQRRLQEPESIEMCEVEEGGLSDADVNNENNFNKELDEESVRIAVEECDASTSETGEDGEVKESRI
ncbi:uncharacterized protein LOC655240 [Tribolium castaneum]|uniref:Uncharacterized protein n=1 Tax=Tribolium castaneum TaxID=7070 RepID=D6WTU1_TRICA|nr:PREDICTED: uncharacterized protein LOC655240 [Tribolium castaneum]EFA07331.1 hypothetical protein TcasGA2_TC015927 [Tribolium castaneum]|eukprot:XP_008200120.1 PREDICTED: uncharacterized protein LOC655240 [Tribolium castaneum]